VNKRAVKSRRPKGTGAVFQRADGLWIARVELGKTNGKRLRREFTASKKSEVEALVRDAIARGGGTIKPRADGTVGELVEVWLEHDVRPNLQPNTYALRESMWRLHAGPILGDVALEALDVEHVEALYRDLRKTNRSENTIRATAAMMQSAINVAIKRRRYHRANPFALVDKPTHTPDEGRALTAQEARRFIKAAKKDRFAALWILMLTTGLRIGEALGLEWRDVDLKAGTAVVRQAVVEVDGMTTVGKPKTKHSKRLIALGGLAIAALRRHKSSPDATSATFVFATATGGHPSRAVLRQRYFLPTCERAKIAGLTMHGLRHTMTSLALAEGGPIAAVSARLGHTTTRMTLDRYGHVLPGQDRGIADALDSVLAKRPSRRDRVNNRV